MKNNESNAATATKLIYETPTIDCKQIELEYGIANGSAVVQQGWKDSQTVTEEVENYYW